MSRNQETKEIQVQDFESFLQKCLDCRELELIDLSVTKLLPPGENYCSTMLKLKAKVRKNKTAEEDTLHLVAKTLNTSDRQVIIWSQVLKKEVFVYAELVPVYKRLEREMGIEPVFDFLPKYIGHRWSLHDDSDDLVDEHSMLLLENLSARNFYTCDRRVGVDFEHAKVALAALARYHSLGIALKQKQPEFFKKAIALADIIGFDKSIVEMGFDALLNTFREIKSFGKHMPIIEECFKNMKNGKPWKRDGLVEEQWLTITHGDFWTNNIMFHKDSSGRVDDVKFVDFQVYVYNSALKDLPYFLCGNLDDDTKTNRVDELLDVYHSAFTRSLERLGCDVSLYSRESFDRELKHQAINNFFYCAMAMKFFVFDAEEEPDRVNISNVLEGKISNAYAKILQQLVDVYEKRGWF